MVQLNPAGLRCLSSLDQALCEERDSDWGGRCPPGTELGALGQEEADSQQRCIVPKTGQWSVMQGQKGEFEEGCPAWRDVTPVPPK